MTTALRLCMLPLAWVFSAVVRVRRTLYARGFLRRQSVTTPTVSVGSLHAGGMGKTPIAGYLLAFCGDTGLKPALLSRGYGRQSQGLRDATSEALRAPSDLGDEPAMLLEAMPTLDVVVSENRFEGAQHLESRQAPDVIVLDDAFSHLSFATDLEFIVIPADPLAWYESVSLPVGTLREPWQAQSLATRSLYWFHAREGAANSSRFAPHVRQIWNQVPETQRILTGTTVSVVESWGGKSPHHGDVLWLSAGIARPKAFEASVREAGFSVAGTSWFRDHHTWTEHEFERCLSRASSAGATLSVTSKDAVKLRRFKDILGDRRVAVFRPTLSWVFGESLVADAFRTLVPSARSPNKKR